LDSNGSDSISAKAITAAFELGASLAYSGDFSGKSAFLFGCSILRRAAQRRKWEQSGVCRHWIGEV
jgi:hypothetical protein